MPRETVGTVICPLLGDIAEVRVDKNGKLYYVGEAGIISPKTTKGQYWLRTSSSLHGQHEAELNQNIEDIELDEREPTAKTGSLLDEFLGWGSK
ncbi:hypothetical protein [Vibrio mimicus]|uniref:hypothetical protein n=1 Tax=Vibrio mimicus TaxID=674 RepID=UPI0012DB0400|nr:hypothetical protein [Vibrio mimicus]